LTILMTLPTAIFAQVPVPTSNCTPPLPCANSTSTLFTLTSQFEIPGYPECFASVTWRVNKVICLDPLKYVIQISNLTWTIPNSLACEQFRLDALAANANPDAATRTLFWKPILDGLYEAASINSMNNVNVLSGIGLPDCPRESVSISSEVYKGQCMRFCIGEVASVLNPYWVYAPSACQNESCCIESNRWCKDPITGLSQKVGPPIITQTGSSQCDPNATELKGCRLPDGEFVLGLTWLSSSGCLPICSTY
jgi:hypothetical protein